MDIERGLEMGILYNPAVDPNKVVRCYFCISQSNCRHFELQLGSGLYEYHGCPSGNLDLPEVEENKPWILKIYTRKAWLMIDLNGVNILKLDTTVGSCSEFWKADHISEMKFDIISQDVVTHYRIAAQQDENEDGSKDFTGMIRMLTVKPSILPGDPRLLCSLTIEIWRNDRLSAAQ